MLVLFSQLIANDGRAEIVETEFDCADAAIFIHRLLFWPRDRLGLKLRCCAIIEGTRLAKLCARFRSWDGNCDIGSE